MNLPYCRTIFLALAITVSLYLTESDHFVVFAVIIIIKVVIEFKISCYLNGGVLYH